MYYMLQLAVAVSIYIKAKLSPHSVRFTMSPDNTSGHPASVPLPTKLGTSLRQSTCPVWPIENAENGVETPLISKCARSSRAGGVCCKELKKEERTLINPDVVRDVYVLLSFKTDYVSFTLELLDCRMA